MIRVTASTLGRAPRYGTLISVETDTLRFNAKRTLSIAPGKVALPNTAIVKLEVARRDRALGFVSGVAIGLVINAVLPVEEGQSRSGMLAFGAASGAVIGLIVPWYRWETVKLRTP